MKGLSNWKRNFFQRFNHCKSMLFFRVLFILFWILIILPLIEVFHNKLEERRNWKWINLALKNYSDEKIIDQLMLELNLLKSSLTFATLNSVLAFLVNPFLSLPPRNKSNAYYKHTLLTRNQLYHPNHTLHTKPHPPYSISKLFIIIILKYSYM